MDLDLKKDITVAHGCSGAPLVFYLAVAHLKVVRHW
jgi:hypothetical protein